MNEGNVGLINSIITVPLQYCLSPCYAKRVKCKKKKENADAAKFSAIQTSTKNKSGRAPPPISSEVKKHSIIQKIFHNNEQHGFLYHCSNSRIFHFQQGQYIFPVPISPFCQISVNPFLKLCFFFFWQKDLGFTAFSTSSQFSIPKCNRRISKKICSVMTPQQSERRPSTTGSVGFLSIFSLVLCFWLIGFIVLWILKVGFLLILGQDSDDDD